METKTSNRYFLSMQEEPHEDRQARMERLEELVCVLLLKNQKLRMALLAGGVDVPSSGYLSDLAVSASDIF